MNRPAKLGALTGDHSLRTCISICQPGKCRHARLAYSIGHQDLAALGVVRQSHGIAEARRSGTGWSATQNSLWHDVAVGGAVECLRGVIAIIGNPDLAIFCVDRQTHGAVDSGAFSTNDSNGSYISAALAVENQDGIVAIVRHYDGVMRRIFGDAHGPIKFGSVALDSAQRILIVF